MTSTRESGATAPSYRTAWITALLLSLAVQAVGLAVLAGALDHDGVAQGQFVLGGLVASLGLLGAVTVVVRQSATRAR